MRRRGFLQCIALSTVAAVLPWRELGSWRVEGAATSPGARMRVLVAAHVPVGARLAMDVTHETPQGGRFTMRQVAQPVAAGQRLELVTPYPYPDLVAGTYVVTITLHDAHGRELERHEAGCYDVRRFRFSA